MIDVLVEKTPDVPNQVMPPPPTIKLEEPPPQKPPIDEVGEYPTQK
jgi:hypothetical protein